MKKYRISGIDSYYDSGQLADSNDRGMNIIDARTGEDTYQERACRDIEELDRAPEQLGVCASAILKIA